MNNIFKIGLLLIIAIFVSTMPAMAIQDPYPLGGYVLFENGTPVGVDAKVTFTNQNTSEVIYDNTSVIGWYSNNAANFPSGYAEGQTISYYTVFGEYTNTTSHVINVTNGSHTMNIVLEMPLKGDLDGDSQITSTDAAIVLEIAVGSRFCDSETLVIADVSGDGRVTSLDALMILQMAAGGKK